jgi:hypothetical protein
MEQDNKPRAFNAKRKIRGVVFAVIATQELHRRLACRARHSTVFRIYETKQQTMVADDFDPKRLFRAAVYVVIASNEIKHWIDAEETLFHDPSLPHPPKVKNLGTLGVTKPHFVGEKFNPRRKFKAAVYAIMFVKDLESSFCLKSDKACLLPGKVRDQEELRSHVKELLAWLGQHPTRPSLVHDFYQDQGIVHQKQPATFGRWLRDHVSSRNPRRKMKSAALAVMAVNRMNENLRRKQLELQVKDRFNWLSNNLKSKVATEQSHFVHFQDPRDEATIPVAHQSSKSFEAKRKALGDTVFVRRAGMLPQHELHRSYSTE